jgi:chromosome segregation ATPase
MGDQLVALQAQLQREENKYERSLLQFNLQLVSKDDEIQQLNGKLRDAKEQLARQELDTLAVEEDRGSSAGDLQDGGARGDEMCKGGLANLRSKLARIQDQIKVSTFRHFFVQISSPALAPFH